MLIPTTTPILTPTPTPPPPAISIFVHPNPVVQGRIALVGIVANRPIHIRGALDEQPLIFIETTPGEYWGIAGAHPLAAPGPYTVTIQAHDEFGWEINERTTLDVTAGAYTSENIDLSPETSALLDPELARAELEALRAMWMQATSKKLWDGVWILPGGLRTTSAFGTRRSFNRGSVDSFHAGQDFAAREGDPVVAPAAGVVALAKSLHVRGNTVWLNHGLGVYSGYFHLTDILVEAGQKVEQGELIGTVGSTGLSTGPHIHWEVRVNGIPVNPLEWTERAIDPFPEKTSDQ
jgi:hypothetical protein